MERGKHTEVMFESLKAKGKGFVRKLQHINRWGRKRMRKRKRIRGALGRAMTKLAGGPRGRHRAGDLVFDQRKTV